MIILKDIIINLILVIITAVVIIVAKYNYDKEEGIIIKEINGVYVTAYCPCSKCNTERYKGRLAIGTKMKYFTPHFNICAVDPKVIPLKSIVIYEGRIYLALDTGSDIKGKHIDLLMNSHKDTLIFGRRRNQTIKVIRNENEKR